MPVRFDRLAPTQHASKETRTAIICFRITLRRGISFRQTWSAPLVSRDPITSDRGVNGLLEGNQCRRLPGPAA
jgi:hypothetical protein